VAGRRLIVLRRALVALLALAWLSAGLAGAYRYVHRYDVYRGFAPPSTPAGIARGTVRTVTFHSSALGLDRQYVVYLPPHYAAESARGRRFPVLYLLHGFPGQPRVFVDAGAIAVDADVLVARHRLRPMILVMPAGKRGLLSGDTEWANGRAGRWMSFVVDVVRSVDHRFATLADRRHRGLAGLSEGAYAALNIGLRHLSMFSVAESWSGYFSETPTATFAGAPPSVVRANSPAVYVPAMASRIRGEGFRTWLYQGRDDTSPPSDLTSFASELHAAGAEVHYGFFPGGHDWGLWRRELPRMLVAAGRWFAQPPTGSAAFTHVGRPRSDAEVRRILRRHHLHCLHRKVRRGEHIGLGCRLYRRAHGIGSPPPPGAT
jgi:enterochelin esterase-like enzyme